MRWRGFSRLRSVEVKVEGSVEVEGVQFRKKGFGEGGVSPIDVK